MRRRKSLSPVERGRIRLYLEKATNLDSEFYIHRRGKPIMSIKFDPSQIHSQEGNKLIDYLLDAESSESKIYVKRPNEGLKRVAFLEEIN
ncbi:hypothetical protein [Synechococcus sp. PCC 7502]|uniref:hypothetical protein n=1 Tax=Synechococcus sp. PCC 7502 TaxID=1173263 RepID=UPI0002F4C6A2|nr:hypothetical protein [Synechococcus sp. PCC 7502]